MIPNWNARGVIPPIAPGEHGASARRAPYVVTMIEVVERYAFSKQRRTILRGLLALRRGLSAAGMTEGFQWLDGSFVEDVETHRSRPPADIDVVSFVPLGDAAQQRALLSRYPDFFVPAKTKKRFYVDAYYRNLDDPHDQNTVRWTAYWYSMWAHRRGDQLWKGFLEVPLSAGDDDEAMRRLDALARGESRGKVGGEP